MTPSLTPTVAPFPGPVAPRTADPHWGGDTTARAGEWAESGLLESLRRDPASVTEQCRDLGSRLMTETDHTRLWYLLACAALAPVGTVSTESRFSALQRLATSGRPYLRFFAYERLAVLHCLDLRFETRAKRVLADARTRERGALRARLDGLLRLC